MSYEAFRKASKKNEKYIIDSDQQNVEVVISDHNGHSLWIHTKLINSYDVNRDANFNLKNGLSIKIRLLL